MNILVISQYYYPEPFRINEICEELVKRGNQVSVITTNPNYPDGEIYPGYTNTYSENDLNGVKVYRCKVRPRYTGSVNLARNYISFVRSVNRFISKKKIDYTSIDIVYVYQLSPITCALPALKIKRKYGLPVFLYCLDVWPESVRGTALEKEPLFAVIGCISKKIYCSVNRIAVTSPCFIEYLKTFCGKKQVRMDFLPQHANPVLFSKKVEPELEQYCTYTNFMFMGNVGEAQNVECIIEAISLIHDRSRFKFHVIGSGSHLDICEELADKLNVKDSVVFHGRHPKDDMPKYYSIADVCVVCLKDEGIVGGTIPGKLQEYMSAEKPILGCINGDATMIIRDAKCGYCVPADNAEELAKAILAMTDNSQENLKFANNARKYYQEYFNIDKHVDEVSKILGELIL